MTAPGTTTSLSHVLVVCTRNRPTDVARCLRALSECDPLPDEILVVDSSDDAETARVVEDCAARGSIGRPVRYLRADRGLTLQRNAGVFATTQDVVHFIDDDTEPEPSYFGEILRVFAEEGADVLGVGGRISNLGDRPPRSRAERFFLLDGPDGTVLPSGKNVHNWSATSSRPTQWLSGCSMSYRRSVFDRELFDAALAGYGLGEDLDFSTRVGRHGRLVHEPRASIVHHVSEAERWPDGRFFRTEIAHRHDRVVRSHAGERTGAFWWSVLGQGLVSLGRGLSRPSRFHLKVAWWTAGGAVAVLRRRARPKGSTMTRPPSG